MLYHQGFVRYLAFEEEIRMGEVRKRDLHLGHFLEVRRLLVNRHGCPDPVVSRSNDYIKTLVDSPWKAMLLSHVVAVNGAKLMVNATELTEPPAGYESVRPKFSPFFSESFVTVVQVIGEPSAASVLNYDELVVYTNDAVLPGYVVMYDA